MTSPRNIIKSPGVANVDEVTKLAYEHARAELQGPSPIWDVSHGSGQTELRPEDVRWLRGRVVVEVLPDVVSDVLHVPFAEDRERQVGPAIVVAMGPPALSKRGREMSPGFALGDTVYIRLPHKSRAIEMGGRMLHVVAQSEVELGCVD